MSTLIFNSRFFYSFTEEKVLYFIGLAMILFIGCRRESGADSINYINFFKYQTDTIQNWTNVEKGYSEYGFYYLSVLIKVYTIILTSISFQYLLLLYHFFLNHWLIIVYTQYSAFAYTILDFCF